jgi:hypothetical protein
MKKIWGNQREYHSCLGSSLKNAFSMQLEPLRSLETATKKRRALKKRIARNCVRTKSSNTASG